MDKASWLEFNTKGEVLRAPRKPEARKKYDTILFDCTYDKASSVIKYAKALKKNGRILMAVPSKDSPKKFPEEAGKIWDETALRETIAHILKFTALKQKLFFKCYPEVNRDYTYFYIALVK